MYRTPNHASTGVMLVLALLASIALVAPSAGAQERSFSQPALTSCDGFAITVNIGAGDQPTDQSDVILGTPGDDTIAAGGGNDLICGLGGNDKIWGQAGNDYIIGGPGNDFLRGGDGFDILLGQAGVDDLSGGRDGDYVHGGDGDDTAVRGGTGDDYVDGGNDDDVLVAGNGGSDAVAGGEGNDALITGGPRPDQIFGGPGNDVIKGLGGADRIFGDSGNDEIRGGRQPDLLDGGSGDDLCNGGMQDDRFMDNCETTESAEIAVPPAIDYTSAAVVDCPEAYAISESISCHVITVPEDDTDPANGRTLDLFATYVDNGDPFDAGPVAFLAGGPGQGGSAFGLLFDGGPVDILAVDQRGTGLSDDDLTCHEATAARIAGLPLTAEAADELQAPAVIDCAGRLLASGVAFDAYNSEQNADDFALIQQALGIEELNVFGISYGTRLAATIMRDHPEGIRASVIDAVMPIENDVFGEQRRNFDATLGALFDGCAATPRCADTYGDVGALFDQAYALLEANPVMVPVEFESGSYDYLVDGDKFVGHIFNSMYRTSDIRFMPIAIAEASIGVVENLVALDLDDPASGGFSQGMFNAVICQDEAVFGGPVVCPSFTTADDSWFDKTPVHSDIPTVVMSGTFDPITPPAWGDEVAEDLSNSTHIEFTDGGHSATIGSECGFFIMVDFFIDPDAPIDQSCADVGLPNWFVPGDPQASDLGAAIAADQAARSGGRYADIREALSEVIVRGSF